jgi:hypothetical protein
MRPTTLAKKKPPAAPQLPAQKPQKTPAPKPRK